MYDKFEQPAPAHCFIVRERKCPFIPLSSAVSCFFPLPHYPCIPTVPPSTHNLCSLPSPAPVPTFPNLVRDWWVIGWIYNCNLSGNNDRLRDLGIGILLNTFWSCQVIYGQLITSNTRSSVQENFKFLYRSNFQEWKLKKSSRQRHGLDHQCHS